MERLVPPRSLLLGFLPLAALVAADVVMLRGLSVIIGAMISAGAMPPASLSTQRAAR